jgi:hypothetical protein
MKVENSVSSDIFLCKNIILKHMMFSAICFSPGSTTLLEKKLQVLGKCYPSALNNLSLNSLKKAEICSWFLEYTVLT